MKRVTLLFMLMMCVIFAKAQDTKTPKVTSISEIIFPASANIRNNFNLFYEIHLNRKEIPKPSFWYKVTFNQDCSFKFNLFPAVEQDLYDFYLFKIGGNQDFCDALADENIEPCYAERENRVYTDTEQSEIFRASLINVKPIEVKAGDAIYLEVFSVKGNDCGHILDFQTDESSFVVKILNDHCNDITNLTNTELAEAFTPVNKDEAFNLFKELLCNPKNKLTNISSIKLNGDKVTVNNKLNLTSHVKSQPVKKVIKPTVQKDTIVAVQPKQAPLQITAPKPKPVKSTADLNGLDDVNRNATRLEVDKVLFSLLNEELNQKLDLAKNKQRTVYQELKKTSKRKKEERRTLMDSIKTIKQFKAELLAKQKEVIKKLKKIDHLLADEYVNKRAMDNDFAFNKSADNVNAKNSLGFAKSVFVEGLVYRIQVGAYKNAIPETIFKGISPIYGEPYEAGIRYSVGSFSRFTDVKEAKTYVVERGLADAFIIAYYNGEKLPIAAAIQLEEKIREMMK
jgi:hypothetical protein